MKKWKKCNNEKMKKFIKVKIKWKNEKMKKLIKIKI
jgi:carboxypeptidase C (cathepsin A)